MWTFLLHLQEEEVRIRRLFLHDEVINFKNPDIPLHINQHISKRVKKMIYVTNKLKVDQTYTAYNALEELSTKSYVLEK